MENLVYLLPVVGCAAMMGVMVWMMRGNHNSSQPRDGEAEAGLREEIAVLRAEVATLREQQTGTAAGQAPGQPSDR